MSDDGLIAQRLIAQDGVLQPGFHSRTQPGQTEPPRDSWRLSGLSQATTVVA